MTLPDFVIIGAGKAGTTSLWRALQQHPEVYMPPQKEPRFFCNEENYGRGLEWYRSIFAGANGERAIGEASASYCMTRSRPEALPRLFHHLPQVKILFCVRHPLERIESAWKQALTTRHPMPWSFVEAVKRYPLLLEGSFYWEPIEKCLRFTDQGQIHVIFFEDLVAEPTETLRRCMEFLEVAPDALPVGAWRAENRSAEKRVTPRFLWPLMRADVRGPIRRVVPTWIRRMLKLNALASAPMPEPRWDGDTLRWVIEEIEEDTRRFLEFAGKPPSCWSFDEFVSSRLSAGVNPSAATVKEGWST